MNFIIEVLPKKENGSVFVWVVRSANGFPIAVCDSLNGARDVIEDKVTEFQKAKTSSSANA